MIKNFALKREDKERVQKDRFKKKKKILVYEKIIMK